MLKFLTLCLVLQSPLLYWNFRFQNEERKLNFIYCFGTSEVKFHYLLWNFCSQIETRMPIVQNEFLFVTAHFFTVQFGTSVPKSKSGTYISLFVLELPLPNQKAEVKFRSHIDLPSDSNRKPRMEILASSCMKHAIMTQWDYIRAFFTWLTNTKVGGRVGGGALC